MDCHDTRCRCSLRFVGIVLHIATVSDTPVLDHSHPVSQPHPANQPCSIRGVGHTPRTVTPRPSCYQQATMSSAPNAPQVTIEERFRYAFLAVRKADPRGPGHCPESAPQPRWREQRSGDGDPRATRGLRSYQPDSSSNPAGMWITATDLPVDLDAHVLGESSSSRTWPGLRVREAARRWSPPRRAGNRPCRYSR